MTGKEAIAMLKRMQEPEAWEPQINEAAFEALELAIEALEAQPETQTARVFQEIIVEYPSISTYPEYEGKPYFSIKYTEDDKGFIGYGTYKPEVLSEYLKEYFMPSAQPKKGKWEITNLGAVGVFDSCSECKRVVKHKAPFYNFCPNCGADMRRRTE